MKKVKKNQVKWKKRRMIKLNEKKQRKKVKKIK